MVFGQWFSSLCFNFVHGHHLIYNTCWEDPRIDRQALELSRDDTLLVLTSAGCNVLDYALLAPQRIYAVDVNPRQNALLELKLAGIKHLDFATFFAIFGRGCVANHQAIYRGQLRPALSSAAQAYWDRHIDYFSALDWPRTFYYRGTAGVFAYFVNKYADYVARVRDALEAILRADSLDEQREIYTTRMREAIWTPFIRWLIARNSTLSMVGVPLAQRYQIERHYRGGLAQFVEACVEAVFTQLPLRDNYFWRVYLCGAYTPDCCPEYLKPDNFARLQAGLVDRIHVYTGSLHNFLSTHEVAISRFVLLDHMDWLSTAASPALRQEWQAIVDRAAPRTRILWRSGGLRVDYVDPIPVTIGKQDYRVGELLTYHQDLATTLHALDRVHTYGSFYIADLAIN